MLRRVNQQQRQMDNLCCFPKRLLHSLLLRQRKLVGVIIIFRKDQNLQMILKNCMFHQKHLYSLFRRHMDKYRLYYLENFMFKSMFHH